MANDREDIRETRRRRGDRGLFGMLLLFAGVVWFLSRAGMLHVAADTLLSILLMCIGAGLLITRRSGRRAWPILLGGVVLFVLMGSSASAQIHWGGAGGQSNYAPTSTSQLQNPYQLGAGDMRLDLTRLAFARTVRVSAEVGAGHLQIQVPTGVGLQVRYQDGFGDVHIDGRGLSHGFPSNSTWSSVSYPTEKRRIVLDLKMGFGDIDVTSAQPSGPSVPTPPNAPQAPPARQGSAS